MSTIRFAGRWVARLGAWVIVEATPRPPAGGERESDLFEQLPRLRIMGPGRRSEDPVNGKESK